VYKDEAMGQGAPTIESEDVPLDEARRMSRGPRIDPELYGALKQNIQSLENTATRMPLPGGHKPDHDEKPHAPRRRRTRHSCHHPESPQRPDLLALHQ
jgi:hypothetical protein